MRLPAAGSVMIKGTIVEGLRESGFFTQLPWVREQFITRLGIDPYPGTLNLDVTEIEELHKLGEIKKQKGIEIVPPEDKFCTAGCFPVVVEGKVSGALIIPRVPDYPETKVEIISSQKIMDVLSLQTGDSVQINVSSVNDKGKLQRR